MFREEWDYDKFKTRFYGKTGLDLESYKDQQMERRIR
ncbi:MAG: chemotaxis protein CheR, partial [Firmicutes bacterium]|nr:chemotaxis protein CheR [Bacillota bacterium]